MRNPRLKIHIVKGAIRPSLAPVNQLRILSPNSSPVLKNSMPALNTSVFWQPNSLADKLQVIALMKPTLLVALESVVDELIVMHHLA